MRRVQILGLEKAKPADTAFAVFDSLAELKRYAGSVSKRPGGPEVFNKRDPFLGGVSINAALDEVTQPHHDLAAKTSKVMNSLQDLVATATERTRDFHYFGRPSVPRALANLPKASVRYREENTATAPLTVVVDTTSSASTTKSQLETIGVYTCAAVAVLSITRPVALYAMTIGKYLAGEDKPAQGFAVRLPSSPIDLPRVAWMLSSNKFCRGICFTIARNITDSSEARHVGFIHWPGKDSNYFLKPGYVDWLRITFGSEVLYFGPKVSSNADFVDITKNPDKWVRDTVERYSTE
jgi:hypothetical protein